MLATPGAEDCVYWQPLPDGEWFKVTIERHSGAPAPSDAACQRLSNRPTAASPPPAPGPSATTSQHTASRPGDEGSGKARTLSAERLASLGCRLRSSSAAYLASICVVKARQDGSFDSPMACFAAECTPTVNRRRIGMAASAICAYPWRRLPTAGTAGAGQSRPRPVAVCTIGH